jgi:hypothetical protein
MIKDMAKKGQSESKIMNYFIKNDVTNHLYIFQLIGSEKVKYGEIEEHLDLKCESMTEADSKTIQDVFGISVEGLWPLDTNTPKYHRVMVVKDKDLMSYKPNDFTSPFSFSPFKSIPFKKFINCIAHPSVK